MSKFTVGIVGGGMVGGAVKSFFPEAKVYDKYKDSDPVAEVAKSDYIFIAVPTPFNNGHDLTEMDDAVATVVKNLTNSSKQVLVLKSTIAPGTTDNYQQKYPEVNFVFNPEFLTEKTAKEDFANPDKQLVGYTDTTKEQAERVLAILPEAAYKKVMPAKACEMVKYATNSYYAFKVIYANTIYDFCERLGLNYDLVKEGLEADHRIIAGNFDVFHGGFRGYGGKCLPKDIKTLSWLARKHGLSLDFIDQVIAINERLLKKS